MERIVTYFGCGSVKRRNETPNPPLGDTLLILS